MFIQPKQGLLPMYLPTEEILTVEDIHTGPVGIWIGMKGVLFCDIDGTVADLEHRRGYIASKPKNYPAFEKAIHLDTPIQPIIDAVYTLYHAGWTVVMCSGRGMQSKDKTVDWLGTYGVPFHAIYMRAVKDYRQDNIIKYELLQQARADGYDPDVVFDDRNQVVEMWRENGIPCVQVAEGGLLMAHCGTCGIDVGNVYMESMAAGKPLCGPCYDHFYPPKPWDMFQDLIDQISYKPGWYFRTGLEDNRMWVQVGVTEEAEISYDPIARKKVPWRGAKHWLSEHMCRNEVVSLVFHAIERAEMHEVREWFRYKGRSIFNPHLDPDALVAVAARKENFNVRENAMTMQEN